MATKNTTNNPKKKNVSKNEDDTQTIAPDTVDDGKDTAADSIDDAKAAKTKGGRKKAAKAEDAKIAPNAADDGKDDAPDAADDEGGSPLLDADTFDGTDYRIQDDDDAQDAQDAPIEDGEALDRELQSQFAEEWIATFTDMSAEEQQVTLYNLMVERLFWHIAYYMRRYPERMASSRATYTDRSVGFEEVRSLMGQDTDDGFAEKWLETNAIPDADTIESRLTMLNMQIDTLMQCDANDTAILHLKRNFELSDIELTILASLVIAMNEEAIMRLMCVAWADFTVRLPTVAFMANLLGDTPEMFNAVKEALSAQGRLRRMRLVVAERNATFPGMVPQIYIPLSVDQDVIDAFCGYIRNRTLPPNVVVHKKGISMRKLIAEPSTVEEVKYALARHGARICLVGPEHSGRRTLLCAVAFSEQSHPIMEINVCREFDNIPDNMVTIHMTEIMRRTLLYSGILMMRFDGLLNRPDIIQKLMNNQAELDNAGKNYPGTIVMLARSFHSVIDEDFNKPIFIHVPQLSVEKAQEVWKKVLAPHTDEYTCERMSLAFSRGYSLPIGSIFRTVADAVDAQLTSGCEKVCLQSHHVLREIQKAFNHDLGSLADVSISDVQLSGVVLNEDCKAQVKEILEYARHLYTVLFTWGFQQRSPYGNSLSMLFAGPPGTGKTLLANAIANELGKVLYRVDLSRIVDKYIGETEKNLGKVFDEAAKAQAIILFDEADALFAKRTEVKSSNDRHANQEINFLLQKLESYNGITILTTNLSKSIDDAFRRRIRFIVDFPQPDPRARASLWKRMIPPGAPLDKGIRWSWLADTFEMSGGHIRNAVLKASVSAAAAGTPINMEHLAKAATDEAHAMGMLLRIEDGSYNDYDGDYDDDAPDENRWF